MMPVFRLFALSTLAIGAMTAGVEAGHDGHVKEMEEGEWLVRGRLISVVPDESASISPIGGDTSIDTSYVPELDFSYFFTKNIALELILATTPHEVSARNTSLGNLDLGDVWLLPPTLTAQYHFDGLGKFKPYVGAGINYTLFYSEDAGSSITDIDYDDSFGPALQAGLDYMLDDRWLLNVDVKKVWINTDVSINGGGVNADVDIDPWVIGLGVGYRF